MLYYRNILFKWLAYVMILFVVLILQLSFLHRVKIMGAHPFIVPLTALCVAILEGPRSGAAFGLAAGIICDTFFPPSVFFFTTVFPIICALTGTAVKRTFSKNFITAFLCSTMAVFVMELLYFIFVILLPRRAGFILLLTMSLPEALSSIIFFPPLYAAINAVHHTGDE